MDIREPEIRHEEILILQDEHFTPENVCIGSGSGTGIGRATAIAAAANKLMTVGLDINEQEGKKTQKMAREMGGQMIFIKADLSQDKDIEPKILIIRLRLMSPNFKDGHGSQRRHLSRSRQKRHNAQ